MPCTYISKTGNSAELPLIMNQPQNSHNNTFDAKSYLYSLIENDGLSFAQKHDLSLRFDVSLPQSSLPPEKVLLKVKQPNFDLLFKEYMLEKDLTATESELLKFIEEKMQK